MSNVDLTEMAWDLASDGFVGHEAAVRQVARTARAAGLSTTLIAVLGDPQQPEVARLRAFGRLAGALASTAARPSIAAHAA